MKIKERFLKYVSINTQADEDSSSVPSSACQLDLARILAQECKEIGFDEVQLDESGIVYATLFSTDDTKDAIGFLAHMDTACELSGKDVKPRIIENYQGEVIQLNDHYSMSKEMYPALATCISEDLIVTDGTTLLGGDDKAGIAIIMSALEKVIKEKIPHGKIMVAFTCDEEVGRGTDTFDLDRFDVDYAYTIDGGEVECVDYENFNAAKAHIEIVGSSIHPGDAKDKMINAGLLAVEFASRFPKEQIPSKTEGREGFYHLTNLQGDVELTTLDYILREHDEDKFKAQKNFVTDLVDEFNQKYDGRFQLEIKDQYKNMYSYIKHDMRCVDKAKQAIEMAGIKPVSNPVRGGTDGAMLSEKGLLTPNLGTGSFNHHGRYEFASIQKMEKMVDIVINIIKY